MTSNNQGNGSSPSHSHSRLPAGGVGGFDAPGQTMKGQPVTGRPPRSSSAGSAGEGTVSGMQLPSDFQAGHFLEPAFLEGMAHELLAEADPQATDGMSAEMPGRLGERTSLPTGSAGSVAKAALDFMDPSLFMGIIQEILAETPLGFSSAPPASVPTPGPDDAFYFLSAGTSSAASTEPFYFLNPAAAAPALPAQVGQPTELASKPAPLSSRSFQVDAVRRDFPILHQTVHGKPLIWMDNAATTQKPRQVIDAIRSFYEHDNSNVHRGAHTLAARATNAYEAAREKVRRFLGASSAEEIVFVHGATEAINLVAQTYGRKFIDRGDEIIVSEIEHHANIVPWQMLVQEKGAVLRVIPVNDRGEVLLEEYEKLLGPRTRFVALTHVSNALGTVLPVRTMIQLAHRHGAHVLIDGAQSVPHLAVDVQSLDADFYGFSGHKLFGPSGIGVIYGKKELLDSLPPWQGGGNMIDEVTFEHTSYQQAPARFEAGTGILAGAVGLGAAIDYLSELGLENIARYEHELLAYGTELLGRIPGLRLIGTAAEKASVMSFTLDGVRTEDVGRFLDGEGIAVRASHHCAQPTMRRFGVTSTVRPSLAFYNTFAELDALAAAVRKAKSALA